MTIVLDKLQVLKLSLTEEFQEFSMNTGEAGNLAISLHSPRPLRIWVDGTLVLEWELQTTHNIKRFFHSSVIVPVSAGEVRVKVETGARPRHIPWVDEHCASRLREQSTEKLAGQIPDQLQCRFHLQGGEPLTPVALISETGGFQAENWWWQHFLIRLIDGYAPLEYKWLGFHKTSQLITIPYPNNPEAKGLRRHLSAFPDQPKPWERIALPVMKADGPSSRVRTPGPEKTRCEPWRETIGELALEFEQEDSKVFLAVPVFEIVGRATASPILPTPSLLEFETVRAAVPQLVLPEEWEELAALYDFSWETLVKLWRPVTPESGLPNGYFATAEAGFEQSLFVWDSCFTTLALVYGWRALPSHANLDCLYSRQDDGGYLHRQNCVWDNTPLFIEPGFSPNPPMMPVAEWALFCLTGDQERLCAHYPALVDQFQWLDANRALPDETFWTTGLANGLDNSPADGNGYPDLTAQMAHFALVLSQIAGVLDKKDEVDHWKRHHRRITRAINDFLWDDQQEIYATSLPEGGHNPHKLITAFWPLWADAVPPDRVEKLASHAQDPKSFSRHHPLPSLAADSPLYSPEGSYWRGSVWTPTTIATIKGFWQAGKHELARSLALRHLQIMSEVYISTGSLWENYAPDRSAPGNWSQKNYSWTAASPILLILEVLLGIEPSAHTMMMRWSPPAGKRVGVRNYPLGQATVSLEQVPMSGRKIRYVMESSAPLCIELRTGSEEGFELIDVPAGKPVTLTKQIL